MPCWAAGRENSAARERKCTQFAPNKIALSTLSPAGILENLSVYPRFERGEGVFAFPHALVALNRSKSRVVFSSYFRHRFAVEQKAAMKVFSVSRGHSKGFVALRGNSPACEFADARLFTICSGVKP
jgi:hypothetical protein